MDVLLLIIKVRVFLERPSNALYYFHFFFKARTHKVIAKVVNENDKFIKCISLEAPA